MPQDRKVGHGYEKVYGYECQYFPCVSCHRHSYPRNAGLGAHNDNINNEIITMKAISNRKSFENTYKCITSLQGLLLAA